jgi:hypothetical protein
MIIGVENDRIEDDSLENDCRENDQHENDQRENDQRQIPGRCARHPVVAVQARIRQTPQIAYE